MEAALDSVSIQIKAYNGYNILDLYDLLHWKIHSSQNK